MAFLARYGNVSPSEYDGMDPEVTRKFAGAVAELRKQEIDLMVNLTRFTAGARTAGKPQSTMEAL
jgi:hypothetical protein